MWECARIEGLVNTGTVGDKLGQEAKIQGSLSLLVELDQVGVQGKVRRVFQCSRVRMLHTA